MEYHVAKQPTVANKILGLAHQRFPEEIDFVIRYLTFLMSVNDENSMLFFFHSLDFRPHRPTKMPVHSLKKLLRLSPPIRLDHSGSGGLAMSINMVV